MRAYSRWLLLLAALLTAGAAWAQEQRPGWLGAELQDLTKAEADKLGWEAPRGAKVVGRLGGSPAAAAGLEPGDVIATLDGIEVTDMSGLIAALIARGAGATVKLRLMRAGKEKTASVTLGARPGGLADGAEMAPQLMLDTGGHMAPVVDLAFAPDSKQLVSGSNDRTVRVWNVETGKTVRIIRGESAPGWGSIYAMALSPDGRWLAVGGYLHGTDRALASAVRLHDFASGKVVALLKGHDEVVGKLAFSPDSKRLISASLGDKTAIIWDLATRRQTLRLSGHAGPVTAVAFTSDGDRAVTGSKDETLRLWSAADGKLIAEMTGHRHAGGVASVAVSPAEAVIAAGADGSILLWDARTGTFLRQLFKSSVPWAIRSLSFSPDGQQLLSASGAGCQTFDVATGRELSDARQLGLRCNGAIHGPDGRLAAAHYNADVHVMDARPDLAIKSGLRSTGASIHRVGFARDGRSIAWGGYELPDPKLTYRLRLPLDGKPLTSVEEISAGEDRASYFHGSAERGPWSVHIADRKDGECCSFNVLKDGTLQTQIKTDDSRAGRGRALMTDEQTVVVAIASGIHAYDLSGRLLGDFVGNIGEVRDIAPSPDGRFLVSGGADQAVRLWNLKTRELIVSLFHGRDGEWVMWTPQGYYTGSPGADKIVGWQINKGPDQAADYVGAEQLREHLHRPDIVEKAIVLASAEQAVREAPGTSFKLADLLARPVPRFKIVSPLPGSTQQGGRAVMKIAIEVTPEPIRMIRAQVNGRQVEEQTPDVGSGGFGTGARVLDVPLAKGRNEVRVTLTNAIGEKAETLVLTHDGDGDLDKRGTLHILSIGVNAYKGLGNACGGASCDLNYSVADARKLADAVEKRLGPGHARVMKRLLVDGGNARDAPTASNIIDAVELLRQAKETDTVVLFIAGHGRNDGPDYRFLPTNAEFVGDTLRGSTVVPWQVLQSAVEAAKGRRILFVDTCHSGNAYNQRLGNAAYHANIIAYTASRFDQEALEDATLGQGLFTYAVVEGLEGKGDLGARRQVSTRELAGYLVRRVGELAKTLKGEQEPQYFKGRDADDYVLVRW